ncbi:MAG TPA: alpha/beta fold hydrolase [Hyphomicrobium sp.]|nr:alpha/beta fold hydrolase [Hyphomicrobium sp.]
MAQQLLSKPLEETPVKPCAEAPAARGRAPCPTARALRTGFGDATARVPSPDADDNDPSLVFADVVDRTINYAVSRLTLGLSPAAVAEAYFDWLVHLAAAPGKQSQLWHKAFRKWMRFGRYIASCAISGGKGECCIEPLPHDKRFAGEAWNSWPYNAMQQAFLLQQQWWHNATTGVRGVTEKHERQVEFVTRQLLDIFSPSNFIPTNPEVLQKTQTELGGNLVRGFWNFIEDSERAANGRKPVGMDEFKVGETLATTPGKVIFRNQLIELIQYEPATDRVRAEPVLIVPAWIMKYYILDLSPGSSLVEYLTKQGFTVFIISWKNPTSEDRGLGFEDYRTLGVGAALKAVRTVVPEAKVHGVGYCLGGTLLATAAAALAREEDDTFKTLTFLAAQVDFEEPGELGLFIDESQVSFLEDMMWEQGYLDAQQMAGVFQLLRSNDLIWSRAVHDYLMGERQPMLDLSAWNADSTRMPYRMHSDYLRQLFLNNDLAEGRYKVDDRPVALTDIRAPVFAVSTESDHVAPWRSVYKLCLLLDTDVTFLLTNGGHNVGIVSPPAKNGRHHRVSTKLARDVYVDPDTWRRRTAVEPGSWWPAWTSWLREHSGPFVSAVPVGGRKGELAPLADAPGSYVLGT